MAWGSFMGSRLTARLGVVKLALAAILIAWPAAALTVFDWEGYEDPGMHPGYIETQGASPAFVFFENEAEALERLVGGLEADLAHPCAQSVPAWREAGVLAPLDPSKIAQWDALDRRLRDLPGFKTSEGVWFVPFDWGATALVHRTDLAPAEAVRSLAVFRDPAFAGRIAIPDAVEDAFALGFLAVGVTDWTAATDADFDAASAFLRAVIANGAVLWSSGPESAEQLASGAVAISWAWNEAATTARAAGAPVRFVIDTVEGASGWMCGYARLRNGTADDARIYAYLNAVLEPRVARTLVETWGYGHGNAAAMAEIDPNALVELGYLDPMEMRARMLAPLHRGGLEFIDPARFRAPTLWQSPAPEALRAEMSAEWARILAGE